MSANAQSRRALATNDRPNIQTVCTFTFSLQTFTIFFLINTFINTHKLLLTVPYDMAAISLIE